MYYHFILMDGMCMCDIKPGIANFWCFGIWFSSQKPYQDLRVTACMVSGDYIMCTLGVRPTCTLEIERETKLANNYCKCDIAGAENGSYNVCIAIAS